MNFKPILIIPGEKKSIFFEIFFKSINSKKFISPLILICNEKIFNTEIKKFNFKRKVEKVNSEKIFEKDFINKKIYLIDITNYKSSNYVQKCFEFAFKLISFYFSI